MGVHGLSVSVPCDPTPGTRDRHADPSPGRPVGQADSDVAPRSDSGAKVSTRLGRHPVVLRGWSDLDRAVALFVRDGDTSGPGAVSGVVHAVGPVAPGQDSARNVPAADHLRRLLWKLAVLTVPNYDSVRLTVPTLSPMTVRHTHEFEHVLPRLVPLGIRDVSRGIPCALHDTGISRRGDSYNYVS